MQNFTGVAPEATLGMWRVFGCSGSSSDEVIMQAMMDAYDAGVDLISMSLGDTDGWSESPSAVLAERIVAKGVPGKVYRAHWVADAVLLTCSAFSLRQ